MTTVSQRPTRRPLTDRVPAWSLAVVSITSVQLGAALSTDLFPSWAPPEPRGCDLPLPRSSSWSSRVRAPLTSLAAQCPRSWLWASSPP